MTPRLLALLLLLPCSLLAQPKPYHLELEANPAAVFPYFSKFGTVTLDVYPSGVRAESYWMNGVTRNGSPHVTAINPVLRAYAEIPISEISELVKKLGGGNEFPGLAPPPLEGKLRGRVGQIPATRHRIVYGPTAYIDLWTTDTIPYNPQLKAIVQELVSTISPATAQTFQSVAGTPIYVELNFRRFKKVALLRPKKLSADTSQESEDLTVGKLYFKAPLIDALWK